MEDNTKVAIIESLRKYSEKVGGQNKASKLLNVSNATISNMLNQKWDNIDEKMWRNVAKQIGFYKDTSWVIVPTTQFNTLEYYLNDAKLFSNVYGIISSEGSGKTTIAEMLKDKEQVIYKSCHACTKKEFLADILAKTGQKNTGGSVAEMLENFVSTVLEMDKPLLILDEADKLSDEVLKYFITIYNQVEGHCGIVLMGTDHLEKRIKKGVRINKNGYKEIYSRLGRKFVIVPAIDDADIVQVCLANGLTDKELINKITREEEKDYRRVKRLVHKYKLEQAA